MEHNVLLTPYTTLNVGGVARILVRATALSDIKTADRIAREQELPLVCIGGGSNIVVPDTGVEGVVLRMELTGVEWNDIGDDVLVTAAAGEWWDDLVAESVTRGLYGAENLSGIPGTIGAAPVQNIGAYGVELSDLLVSVDIYDRDTGTLRSFSKDQCRFGYRHSLFKEEPGRFIIYAVTLRLSKTRSLSVTYTDLLEKIGSDHSEYTSADIREAVLSIRSQKFPDLSSVGTAGSFFKNPIITKAAFEDLKRKHENIPCFSLSDGRVKIPLAWILDKVLDLKGVRVGNVGLCRTQPLVLVTYPNATADEVTRFADSIAERVYEHIGIRPEYEVTVLS